MLSADNNNNEQTRRLYVGPEGIFQGIKSQGIILTQNLDIKNFSYGMKT